MNLYPKPPVSNPCAKAALDKPVTMSIRLHWNWSRFWPAFASSRIPTVAGSLAFTSILSLVPITLLSVNFFAVLPHFLDVETNLRQWLLANLLPENLNAQVLQVLNNFTTKADQMSHFSLLFLGIVGMSLTATVEDAFNHIWRVKCKRPWLLRIWVHVFLLTLGPLLLGIGIVQSDTVVQALRTYLHLDFLQGTIFLNMQFALLFASLTLFYKYIPYTHVQWRQAILGALVAAISIVLARYILAWYFVHSAVYTTLYGALAAIPIFLIWIYVVWFLLLLGAVFGTCFGKNQKT